jgi:hypothetical protein
VSTVSVSLMGKRGQVFYLPSQATPKGMIAAVDAAGYEASLYAKGEGGSDNPT